MSISDVIYQAGHLPHLLSKVDPVTKSVYRKKYRKFKKVGGVTILTAVGTSTAVDFFKDVSVSKLKAYGYKTMFFVVSGPLIQVFAVPMYIFSYGTRLRNLAIAIMEVGSLICKGEVEVSTFFFIFLDFVLFGEYVSATEGENWRFIGNETDSKISNVVNSVGVCNE